MFPAPRVSHELKTKHVFAVHHYTGWQGERLPRRLVSRRVPESPATPPALSRVLCQHPEQMKPAHTLAPEGHGFPVFQPWRAGSSLYHFKDRQGSSEQGKERGYHTKVASSPMTLCQEEKPAWVRSSRSLLPTPDSLQMWLARRPTAASCPHILRLPEVRLSCLNTEVTYLHNHFWSLRCGLRCSRGY